MENLKTEKTEKMTKLFFNNRPYTFSDANLITICDYLIANESIDEYEKKYVLSFIKNSIVRKTYDEMDYHEFIIEDSFRISQLLCNVDNIFGRKVTEEFAKEIGPIFGEEITWDSTNYFETVSVSDAMEYWKRTSASKESQINSFKRMLGLLYLYDCIREDYMQTVTDFDDFGAVEFINGVVIKKTEYNGHLFLKPVEDFYDSNIEDCNEVCGIYIPPIVMNAIFNTEHDVFFVYEKLDSKMEFLLKLKLEQLTGNLPELKNLTVPKDANKDNLIEGMWYKYDRSDNSWPPLPGSLLIFLFDANGKHKRSVQFGDNITKIIENWGTLEWNWFTEGNRLHIVNKKLYQEDVELYEVDENTLIIGKNKFYRRIEDALDFS